jgi:hypothetical protein
LGLLGTQKVSRLPEILGPQGFPGVPLPPLVPGPLEVAGSSSITGLNGFRMPPGVPRLIAGNEPHRVPGPLGMFRDSGPLGDPKPPGHSQLRNLPGFLGPHGVPGPPGVLWPPWIPGPPRVLGPPWVPGHPWIPGPSRVPWPQRVPWPPGLPRTPWAPRVPLTPRGPRAPRVLKAPRGLQAPRGSRAPMGTPGP